MTSTDTRSKPNSKPWKPEVTPPRRRRGNFRGKGGRQNDSGRQTNNTSGTNGNSSNGSVITDNFHHLLMKFHSYVLTHFYIPSDKN